MPHFSESPRISGLFNRDPELANQIRDIVANGHVRGLESGSSMQKELEAYLDKTPSRGAAFENANKAETLRRQNAFEAIVRLIGRPPLLVQGGTFITPAKVTKSIPQATISYINTLSRTPIDSVIAKTGRVDIVDIPGLPFVGTAWIVEKPKDDIATVVTNRHVATEFARDDGSGKFRPTTAPNLRPYVVELGLTHEYESDTQRQLKLIRVRYIAADGDPDVALLEVQGEAVRGLDPVVLSTTPVETGQKIGVVGYPAYDSRNDDAAIASYFDAIFRSHESVPNMQP